MKVFISWSGESSRRVADLLRKYLPCMIQDLKPFMSQHDLSSGGRWTEQLSKELEQSNFGIVCLTPDNLQSPWILFEAGALTKHVEGRACCLLLRGLGLADVSGPLSQFQNRVFSRGEFQKLMFDMNDLLDSRIDKSSLQMIVEKWWPDLDAEVTAALADPELAAPTKHKRDQSDLMEELLLRVRNIQRVLEAKSPRDQGPVVGNAIRDVLDRTWHRVIAWPGLILQELVTPAGTALVGNVNDLESRYSKSDIDSLLQASLVARKADGVIIVHDLIANISQKGTQVKIPPTFWPFTRGD